MNGIKTVPDPFSPFGSPEWVQRMAGGFGLESTLRPRGRPRKEEEEA